MYTSRISSTVRVRPGGQSLVVSEVLGEVAGGTTALVEGIADLNATVRVARSLGAVQRKKVIAEICYSSTEELVIKKGTPIAAVTVVPASAFEFEELSKSHPRAETPSPAGCSSPSRDSDWIHAAIGATTIPTNTSADPIPEVDNVLRDDLDVNYADSKLGNEQRKLLAEMLGSFKDMFVETSMKPGRTDLLEFSIDTGDHSPIKQPPYRVLKAEGDVMEAEIQQYLDLKLIRPSTSPWNRPAMMIRKPDGEIRFCIEYRVADLFGLPRRLRRVQRGLPHPPREIEASFGTLPSRRVQNKDEKVQVGSRPSRVLGTHCHSFWNPS
ncbi:hypothetical protein ON010_g11554 [Phytophthora cinnamomi]|nr:hypothetical protein ON010_g11554 [Phytophthora cinnamomi]